jgi:2OG-Fe(II) oxygenase superfamily
MDALSLQRNGAEILDHYLTPSLCLELLHELDIYKVAHDLPLIDRAEARRSLRYRVIDGDRVFDSLPGVLSLYGDVLAIVRRYDPRLGPLANQTARLNVNVTPPGGEYRWHYDRNSVTAILFLNTVEGGHTEMYPNCRIHLDRWKDRAVQRVCDDVVRRVICLTRPLVVAPSPGRMIMMRADRCLHSVRKVEGHEDRVSVIMAFDQPGGVFSPARDLDSYLYSHDASPERDPNYRL